MELLPVDTDAFYGLPYVQDLAFIYTLNGDTEAAVQQLEYLLSIPSWMSVSWLRMDPEWDLLRDTPAFNRILARTSIGFRPALWTRPSGETPGAEAATSSRPRSSW